MFTYKTKARAVDTDLAGHVHFSNYFRFMERAEEAFMESFGMSFEKMEKENFMLPKVESKCNYLSPTRCNDEIKISLKIEEIKQKSYRYKFKIHNLTKNREAAEGHIVVVYIDTKKGEPSKIPADLRKELEKIEEK